MKEHSYGVNLPVNLTTSKLQWPAQRLITGYLVVYMNLIVF